MGLLVTIMRGVLIVMGVLVILRALSWVIFRQ